ncbi:MAG: alpha-glucan family phosphorylase [Bacteroidota bacterium]
MTTRSKLESLAGNMWWAWSTEAQALFHALNPDAFRAADNSPVAALQAADVAVLADAEYAARVDAIYAQFDAYMNTPGPYSDGPVTAYFCMEYGLHESMSIYSGGLGVLAGDHAKAASDLGLPFTTIGLLLRDGYFKQTFGSDGWQEASYPTFNPTTHPLTLATDDLGTPLVVTVHLGHQPLHLMAWRLDLGRTAMYFLDSDFGANPDHLRKLTCRLYGGDRTTRIQQEIILGIGGMRLLRALGQDPEVYHLNEGHCAFLTFELLREKLHAGTDRLTAENEVRAACVFTTHTPVKAGHDYFEPELFLREMDLMRETLGMSHHDILSYGRTNPHDMSERFTMTVLGLKLARQANGVSKLNGEVARDQWKEMYPDRSVDEVPIGQITNGVHLPTWTSAIAKNFYSDKLGDWWSHYHDTDYWAKAAALSDAELWELRSMSRRALVEYVNVQVTRQTLNQQPALDPEALTIGFARRFATYKRAPLFFHHLERAIDVFSQEGRPIQLIYAGKAHPADKGGQAFIKQIYDMTQHPAFKGRLIFLENYNMEIGRMMTSGSDVWLNNPRRPYEASGTSGQKVASHGGLNLSILDGWWPEGYNGTNGWSIGDDASSAYKDPAVQDNEDATFLYDTLLHSVMPDFYERDANGLPTKWIARMRQAIGALPLQFSARRQVTDYIEQMYKTS